MVSVRRPAPVVALRPFYGPLWAVSLSLRPAPRAVRADLGVLGVLGVC